MGDIYDARVGEDVRRVLRSFVQALGVWARSEGKGEGGAELVISEKGEYSYLEGGVGIGEDGGMKVEWLLG